MVVTSGKFCHVDVKNTENGLLMSWLVTQETCIKYFRCRSSVLLMMNEHGFRLNLRLLPGSKSCCRCYVTVAGPRAATVCDIVSLEHLYQRYCLFLKFLHQKSLPDDSSALVNILRLKDPRIWPAWPPIDCRGSFASILLHHNTNHLQSEVDMGLL